MKNCRQFSLLVITLKFITLFSLPLFSQQRKIDSLLTLLKTAKEDSNKVKKLGTLGAMFLVSSKFDTSLIFQEQALSLAKKLNFKAGIAYAYNGIGNVYAYQGKYPMALKNYLTSVKVWEEVGFKINVASTYINIGTIYNYQANYPEALKQLTTALKIEEEINNKDGMASCYNILGIIYEMQGKFTEAFKQHAAALKIEEEMGYREGIASTYNNMGTLLYRQNNFPEALIQFLKSIKIKEEFGDKMGLAASYTNIGVVYYELNKPLESKIWLQKGLASSKEIGDISVMREAYQGLSTADSMLGNYKAALENYKLYIVCRDSLINEENTKKTVQHQMQFDFDKKSCADSIKNAEAKKLETINYQSEIRNQKYFTYSGIVGFLVMIVVAGISFRAFRNKKKANVLIAHQKELVEEKQKEILDSIYYARRIQRSLLTSEKYFSKNLNRLSNN